MAYYIGSELEIVSHEGTFSGILRVVEEEGVRLSLANGE